MFICALLSVTMIDVHERLRLVKEGSQSIPSVPRGGRSTEFYMGRLLPEVQPLALFYTNLTEKVPLLAEPSHIGLCANGESNDRQ